MALWRRILFVSYAVGSYIYRWVVTFAILYFLYSFLRPHKLEVISQMLALGAAASMAGWPLFRMGKAIYRRGRLPDMKKWRVLVSATVLTALVLFACLVPVPVGRIRVPAVVQADPAATGKVYVHHDGILKKLNVRPGDHVTTGQVLAVFTDHELETELLKWRTDRDHGAEHIKVLEDRRRETTDQKKGGEINAEIGGLTTKWLTAKDKVESLEAVRSKDLVLRAPCSGVIGQAPAVDSVTKFFQADPNTPFCTINNPGRVRICVPLVTQEFNRLKEDLERLSPAATKSRRLMKMRVTVAWNKTRLADALADLQKQVKGLHLYLDKDGGVSENLPVTYQAKEQRLGWLLDAMFERLGLGFVIQSEAGEEHDGWLLVRAGRERGEPEGGRPLANLDITLRIQGRGGQTWKGKVRQLPESEAKTVPLALSNRAGGPVAVKAGTQGQALVPATQYYLVYVEIVDPDDAIVPGTMAQVKVACQPETCLHWLWRTLNNTFDLGLM
jgi:hypothetical protein